MTDDQYDVYDPNVPVGTAKKQDKQDKTPGLFERLIAWYNSNSEDKFAQALFLIAICVIAGLVFIFLYATQAPFQMALDANSTTSANATNVTNVTGVTTSGTTLQPTLWDSVLIVVSIFGAGVLVAGAFFFVGGLLGFLFGIPKSIEPQTTIVVQPAQQQPTNQQQPGNQQQPQNTQSNLIQSTLNQDLYKQNTNLEDISDWLTKIIIGVGLIELTKIPTLINQYAEMIAPALGGIPSSGAFGIALLVYYSIAGFLFVYVATRAYMETNLEKIKRMELEKLERQKEEAKVEKLEIETELKMLEWNKREMEQRIDKLNENIRTK